MGYVYSEQRAKVFLEETQPMFLKIRDAAKRLIAESGAVTAGKLIQHAGSGDSWTMLACIDRLAEIGELHPVPNPHSRAGQDQIYVQ